MATQFDVKPLGGFNLGQGLNQLASNIGQQNRYEDQQAQMQKQEQQQQEMQGFMRQAIDGDPVAMKEVLVRNPNIGAQLQKIESERQAKLGLERKQLFDDNNFDYAKRVRMATPEEIPMIIQQAIDDPNSDLYDQDDLNISEDEAKLDANMALYSRLGDKGYDSMFGGQGKDLTSKERDFNKYQELLAEDKGMAELFGRGAGFVKDENKRIFKIEDGVKYFSDGTEETVNPKEKLKTDDMKAPMSQEQALKVVDKAKEGQLKNAGFAITMNDGVNKVNEMVSGGYDPTSAGWVNKYLAGTTVGNLVMTEEDQTFVGAVEQMINAIARRETGAAITEFERKDFFNRYMPVAGDKPARIKQKRNALERQFKSIRGQAGSVYDAIRVTQGFDKNTSSQPEIKTQVIIKAHPQYGDVTEDDIQTTMSQSGMTREQVLSKLGG